MLILENKIKEIVCNKLKSNDDILTDVSLKEYGMESIDLVKIIVEIEKTFKIEILDSDLTIENFETLEAIKETVKKYILFQNNSICKCVILDCDNILWSGIAGETGTDAVEKNNSHYILYNILHQMKEKGILICLCSSNNKKNIENCLQNTNPLIINDFLITCYNSKRKSTDIKKIIEKIGCYPYEVLYVDDSRRTCMDVAKNIETLNIYCVKKIENLVYLLNKIVCNEKNNLPIDRTEQYRLQIKREKLKKGDISKYNKMLKTEILCKPANANDISRISNLSFRAHRFNMTGNHLNESKLNEIYNNNDYKIFTLSVNDKFGDMGIVAFLIIYDNTIKEFVLSCRAFNRGFEDYLLDSVKKYGYKICQVVYNETDNNSLCKEFIKKRKMLIVS